MHQMLDITTRIRQNAPENDLTILACVEGRMTLTVIERITTKTLLTVNFIMIPMPDVPTRITQNAPANDLTIFVYIDGRMMFTVKLSVRIVNFLMMPNNKAHDNTDA